MAAITHDGISGATAEVNYIRNPPAEPGVTLTFVTEAEERSTMILRLAPDALHPNAEGNRRWAEFLAPLVS